MPSGNNRKRRGEAGGAELHCLRRAKLGRNVNDGVRGNPCVFRVSAVPRLAESTTIDQHGIAFAEAVIAGGNDRARKIDATNQRIVSQDPALAGRGQRILVIDRRMTDFDDDIAFAQVVNGQLRKTCNDVFVLLVDPECAKFFHVVVPLRLCGL
jgi:hypothetical protein